MQNCRGLSQKVQPFLNTSLDKDFRPYLGSFAAGAGFVAQGVPADMDGLTKMIEAMGWSRQSVYITNILMCRPPGNRNPQPERVVGRISAARTGWQCAAPSGGWPHSLPA